MSVSPNSAASLAAILESRGIRVTNSKLDPYINVDLEALANPEALEHFRGRAELGA